jgi:hypothetical protein
MRKKMCWYDWLGWLCIYAAVGIYLFLLLRFDCLPINWMGFSVAIVFVCGWIIAPIACVRHAAEYVFEPLVVGWLHSGGQVHNIG